MTPLPLRPSAVWAFLRQSPVSHGLAIRFVGVGLAFVQAILLARLAPPDVYGAYSVGMSFATLLGTVSCLGLAQLSVREIPTLRRNGGASSIQDFVRQTIGVVLAASVAVSVITAVTLALLPPIGSGILRQALVLTATLIPLMAFLRLSSSQLRGFGFPAASLLSEFLVRPLFFIPALIVLGVAGSTLRLPVLVGIAALATIAANVVSFALLWKQRHARTKALSLASVPILKHLSAGFPFLLSSVATIAQSEVPNMMLGAISGAVEAGLLQPVLRIGLLLGIGHMVVSYPLAPKVALLWNRSDLAGLRVASLTAARKSILLTLPACLLVMLFSKSILGIFGARFVEAAPGLIAIACGQLINSLTGYGGLLLGMTHHQHVATKIQYLGLFVTLVLVGMLSGAFGAIGAACAIAVGMGLTNVVLVIAAFRLTKVNGTIFQKA